MLPWRTTLLGSRPMIERESTDLPEPDSPTMPIVLPRSSVSDTPSTARTSPRGVLKNVFTLVDLEQRPVERRRRSGR